MGSAIPPSQFQPGDKVAVEVGLPCEQCQRCQEGRYNICPDVKFRSSGKAFPHFQGTLQSRINHPAKWVYKLPEEMDVDVGALLEPLGVALHAYRRSLMPKEDATVVVFGAGAVGLLCAAVAKLKGAKKVVIADIDAGRLEFAVQNGFAHQSYTVPMRRGKDIEESLQIAKETAAEVGRVDSIGEVDVVFECTGVPSCVQAGIYVSSRHAALPNLFCGLILLPVDQARWPPHVGRDGPSHSNTALGCRCTARGGHCGCVPICQHVQRKHRHRATSFEISGGSGLFEIDYPSLCRVSRSGQGL